MEPDRTIRIVIADDHRLFREGIRLLLKDQKDLEIVGEAANGLQAIDMVSDLYKRRRKSETCSGRKV